MTFSVLKQDLNIEKIKKNAAFIMTVKAQYVNFLGQPLFQATKQHLNNS